MVHTSRIYLLRHGIPSNDYIGPYDVLPGPELSESGRKQAVQAAKWLNSKNIDLVYSSPFARAYQTAEPIFKLLNIKHKIVSPLQEQNNQETDSILKNRVTEWWRSESRYLSETTLLIISHGAPLNAFISIFNNNANNNRTFGRGNMIPMGGIWEINQNSNEIRSKLVWVPPFLDDLGHPELKNIKLDFEIGTEL